MLDEALEGKVLAIEPEAIRILTEDGLEIEVAPADLVRVPDAGASDLRQAAVHPKPEPASRPRTPSRKASGRKRKVPPMEVDLHAEKLFPSLRNINPYEILDRQLDTARGQLEFAIRNRIQRIVFIHGVGQGVLREELRTLFRRYDGVQYRTADFRVYGEGATEVYIPQSCFT